MARDYATKRFAFGSKLSDKPLHLDTLAGCSSRVRGAFHLAFRVVELIGKEEAGSLTEAEGQLLRLLTPIAKLVTAKQAVLVTSEILEIFGGAGYIEDTGLPRLLRDAQVLPIWEGTTNVLSLDVLRVLGRGGTLEVIEREVGARVERGGDKEIATVALSAIKHAQAWLEKSFASGVPALEAGARRFALTLGRVVELALLVDHGAWSKGAEGDGRAAAAARMFAAKRGRPHRGPRHSPGRARPRQRRAARVNAHPAPSAT